MIKLYVAGTKPVLVSQLKVENAIEELQQSLETGILPVHLIDIFTEQEVGTSCIKVIPYDDRTHYRKKDENYGYTNYVFPFLMQDLSTGEIIDLKTVNTDKIIDSWESRIWNVPRDTTASCPVKLFEGWQPSDRMVYCGYKDDSHPFYVLNIDKGEIVISGSHERKIYEYFPVEYIRGVGEWGGMGNYLKYDRNFEDEFFIRGAIDPAALAGISIYPVYDIPSYITRGMVKKITDAKVCLGGDGAPLKLSNVTEFDFRGYSSIAMADAPAPHSVEDPTEDLLDCCAPVEPPEGPSDTVVETTSFFGANTEEEPPPPPSPILPPTEYSENLCALESEEILPPTPAVPGIDIPDGVTFIPLPDDAPLIAENPDEDYAMEEVKRAVNKHTFTACRPSSEFDSFIVHATRGELKEAIKNMHLDLIIKNAFSGEFSTESLFTFGFPNTIDVKPELDVCDIEPFKSNPFGLYVSLSDKSIIPIEVVDALPEGWRYDDPCITTYVPNREISLNDFIVNLRTEEIVFLKKGVNSPVSTMIPSPNCPEVSGEAQLIFSMFVNRLNTYGLMNLCRAYFPLGITWYGKLVEDYAQHTKSHWDDYVPVGENRFFIRIIERVLHHMKYSDDSPFQHGNHSYTDLISINNDSAVHLADEQGMYTYISNRILNLPDQYEPLQYEIINTEANISYMDKMHARYGYFRDTESLPSTEAKPSIDIVTYRKR